MVEAKQETLLFTPYNNCAVSTQNLKVSGRLLCKLIMAQLTLRPEGKEATEQQSEKRNGGRWGLRKLSFFLFYFLLSFFVFTPVKVIWHLPQVHTWLAVLLTSAKQNKSSQVADGSKYSSPGHSGFLFRVLKWIR